MLYSIIICALVYPFSSLNTVTTFLWEYRHFLLYVLGNLVLGYVSHPLFSVLKSPPRFLRHLNYFRQYSTIHIGTHFAIAINTEVDSVLNYRIAYISPFQMASHVA